jgi:polysaccharide biosynthesis protein PslH
LLEDLLSLQKVSKISYHCIETAKHPFDSSAFLQHDKLTVTTHFVDTGISIYGAILALLRQESYNLTRFKSTEVHTAIKQELHKENYDFVIFESLFAAVYAPNLRPYSKAKFIYRAHNIEHQIWKDLAGNTKNLPKKWYLNQLAYSLKWAERSIWSEDQGGLELILTISDTDLSIIEGQTLTACRYLPASITHSGQQSTLAQQQLCFLGAFNWKPNAEAVEWFLSQIFPLLKQQHPLLTFHIAGKGAENIKHWQQPGVLVHGFVPDAKEFMATHGIFVGCLQSGSGVKMKILEAMSVGAPIVLSNKSADGLPDLQAHLIQQDQDSFLADILELLENQEKIKERAAYFSHYFERHFEAKEVQRQLLQMLEELQNNR